MSELGSVNVARSGFQQRETDSTPFIISKTNSNETVENQRAEARPRLISAKYRDGNDGGPEAVFIAQGRLGDIG